MRCGLSKEELYNQAVAFRQAIMAAKEDGKFSFKDRMISFPKGCCDDTVDLFAHYLYLYFGIISERIDGTYYDLDPWNNCSHSWLEINGWVVDLTGDQFKNDSTFLRYDKEVYVGEIDAFHSLFEEYRRVEFCGIEDLSENCWERMYSLYNIILKYLE